MIELTLPGMTCGGCARGVTAAIKAVDPTAEVVTDVAARKVRVTTKADTETVKDAVKNAGYLPA
ncbi:heavy-metal-associated domain-containing protein [Frigidibacter mobilis]|uniref:Copper ion binding protein n=1 Tax=Frigidibacter mobilis TaxID=1335048 RepID=A0A159Z7B4_9RHOB|nr:heavy-metal-associated domain-containing protein [Frigidibacter mobilis]AMY71315.1 copper ion binding protein [Frigidibacter mobilis]